METSSLQDPIDRFAELFERAGTSEPSDPTATILATADREGRPTARVVLLKAFDRNGFVFFTNKTSRKGQELRENPRACMLFWYASLGEQCRIEGRVEEIPEEENEAYFATRPRMSQVGAWASEQSRPLESREELLRRCAEVEARYPDCPVERPPHWGGYRIVPDLIEFWKAGEFRLHDRFVYTRPDEKSPWTMQRLNP